MSQAAPIIVGTDLSHHSDLAVVEAARRARRDEVSLLVVHVASEETIAMVDATKVAAALRQHVERLTTGDIECLLTVGSPHAELIKLADKRGASLVVVGASGEGSVGDALFGTTAENVVRYAHGPVLVVRESPADSGVLVGTDFSAESLPPLRVGAQEAKKASVALTLFHSTHQPRSRLGVLGQNPPSDWKAPHLGLGRGAIENKLKTLLAAEGAEARTVIADTPPGPALAALAGEEKASLVVVGTHGRTGLKRMALGSVAASVVRSAPCSVLVVR